ncbi:DNA alkylation repair protein [bacterium]|nr:MAG: DNA alkylation repair protein [bacterium]
MNKIILQIKKELKDKIDKGYKQGSDRFFKDSIKSYGVRTPIVRGIARRYFLQIKDLGKKEIFCLADELLKSEYFEEIIIAFDWVFGIRKQYTESDFKIFENWLKKHVSNWASCDDFCGHTLGYFLLQFPEFLPKTKTWTKSKNRWLRRASAVAMIYPNRKDKYIKNSFEIADILLEDKDDLVQKGYGWMLKEISNLYPEKVFDYVMKNRNKMPRTALRYAIEKLSVELKREAMG